MADGGQSWRSIVGLKTHRKTSSPCLLLLLSGTKHSLSSPSSLLSLSFLSLLILVREQQQTQTCVQKRGWKKERKPSSLVHCQTFQLRSRLTAPFPVIFLLLSDQLLRLFHSHSHSGKGAKPLLSLTPRSHLLNLERSSSSLSFSLSSSPSLLPPFPLKTYAHKLNVNQALLFSALCVFLLEKVGVSGFCEFGTLDHSSEKIKRKKLVR